MCAEHLMIDYLLNKIRNFMVLHVMQQLMKSLVHVKIDVRCKV
jgi:hypothetical protein